MTRVSRCRILAGCLLVHAIPGLLWAQLYSVDEAAAQSKTTGRPIFAMAGNKT